MNNKRKKYVVSLIVLFIGMVAIALPVAAQRRPTKPRAVQLPAAVLPTEDTLTVIRRRGKLNVGIATFIPWTMQDKNGKWIGFEIEVAKKLAADLGVDVNLMPTGQGALLSDLQSKRFDIVVTGMYPTPARALVVNFSEPYSKSKIELMASREKAGRKGDFKDYNDSDVTIGVVAGTVYAEMVKANFPKATIREFDDEATMVMAVSNGEIHAAMASTPTPEFAMKYGGAKVFRPLADPLATMDEAFAIRKGDVDFLNYLNTWIRYYERSGWLKKERHHWFETMDWKDEL